jgi:hypothetical protein
MTNRPKILDVRIDAEATTPSEKKNTFVFTVNENVFKEVLNIVTSGCAVIKDD